MLKIFLLLSMAVVAIKADGMPLLCDSEPCEASDFEAPSTYVDTTNRYLNFVQVNGLWVPVTPASIAAYGGILPPRERLGHRRNSTGTLPRPYVETMWESYATFPADYNTCPDTQEIDENAYGARLKDVPILSTDGMIDGADIVDISYANADKDRCSNIEVDCDPYICGLHLFKNVKGDADRYQNLMKDIQELKKKGGVVNLAFGGDEWGNLMFKKPTIYSADRLVDDIIKTAMELHVDGINLVQESGTGPNLLVQDETSVQLYMLDALRSRMPPQMMLTYTFPGKQIDFPFRDIVKYGHGYMDHINVHMANPGSIAFLMEIGVPRVKLGWGIPIGCNSDDIGDWGLEDTINIAKIARDHGFAGVMEWSINRDTNRRVSGLGCCGLQTGMPDGTYISNIAAVVVANRLPTLTSYHQGGTYTGLAECTL